MHHIIRGLGSKDYTQRSTLVSHQPCPPRICTFSPGCETCNVEPAGRQPRYSRPSRLPSFYSSDSYGLMSFDLEGERCPCCSFVNALAPVLLYIYIEFLSPRLLIVRSTITIMSRVSTNSSSHHTKSPEQHREAFQGLLDNHWSGDTPKPNLRPCPNQSTLTANHNPTSGLYRPSFASATPSQDSTRAGSFQSIPPSGHTFRPGHVTSPTAIDDTGSYDKSSARTSGNQAWSFGSRPQIVPESSPDSQIQFQLLAFATSHPDTDISHFTDDDQAYIRSCWKVTSMLEQMERTKGQAEYASALYQTACLSGDPEAQPKITLPESLLPYVELVREDHLGRWLNSEPGDEGRVRNETEGLCSAVVNSVRCV